MIVERPTVIAVKLLELVGTVDVDGTTTGSVELVLEVVGAVGAGSCDVGAPVEATVELVVTAALVEGDAEESVAEESVAEESVAEESVAEDVDGAAATVVVVGVVELAVGGTDVVVDTVGVTDSVVKGEPVPVGMTKEKVGNEKVGWSPPRPVGSESEGSAVAGGPASVVSPVLVTFADVDGGVDIVVEFEGESCRLMCLGI